LSRGGLVVSDALYPRAVLKAAAAALADRARVELRAAGRGRTRVDVLPRALEGDFLNEALSALYRARVAALEGPFAERIVERVLRSGFVSAPKDPLEEMDPALAESRRRQVDELLARSRA